MKVYVVHAYRWGDREMHSYSVGVFSTEAGAIAAAETEAEWRGGKYECEVREWTLDKGDQESLTSNSRVVLTLPVVPTNI